MSKEERYGKFKELVFHRKCYSAFTNIILLTRDEARCKKADKEVTSLSVLVSQCSDSNKSSDLIPKKFLPSN